MTADLVDQLTAVPGVARADGWITDQGTYVIGTNGKVIGGGGAPGIGRQLRRHPGRGRRPDRHHHPGFRHRPGPGSC